METFDDYGIDAIGSGEIKTICPQCSPSRKKKNIKCLAVNVDEGIWNCFHCGWTGNLRKEHKFTKAYSLPKPSVEKKVNISLDDLNATHLDYIKKRGISEPVILRNKISSKLMYMPAVAKEVECFAFPYFKNGLIANVKYRDLDKNFRQETGAEKIVYGYDDIAKQTIVVEGEFDKLAYETAGFKNCISVPDGASPLNTKNYQAKFSFLNDDIFDSVEEFIISTDSDPVGVKLGEELSRRFGKDKCRVVRYPEDCKDANEVLLKHGVEGVQALIQKAKAYPVEGVFTIDDIYSNVQNIFEGGMPSGEKTGWECLDELYSPVQSQWTLLTGIPSMGKSEFMDALAVNLANAGWVIGVCSPENQPFEWHCTKLLEKRVGKRISKLSKEEFDGAIEWLNQHFYFILPEEPSLNAVLANAKILVKKYGMRGLIIDPYNELDHTRRDSGVNETEYVSSFLTKLRKFARENEVHIWLVAHPAKLAKDRDGNYPVPDGYSVSGSAHFFNKADNIMAVHRTVGSDEVEIHVQKVRSRWLGKVGMCKLMWNKKNGRFKEWSNEEYSYNPVNI